MTSSERTLTCVWVPSLVHVHDHTPLCPHFQAQAKRIAELEARQEQFNATSSEQVGEAHRLPACLPGPNHLSRPRVTPASLTRIVRLEQEDRLARLLVRLEEQVSINAHMEKGLQVRGGVEQGSGEVWNVKHACGFYVDSHPYGSISMTGIRFAFRSAQG